MLEQGLSAVSNKGKAILYSANVSTAIRYQILPKASETATLLDRLVVADIYGKKQSRYKHFFGKVK